MLLNINISRLISYGQSSITIISKKQKVYIIILKCLVKWNIRLSW